MGTPFFIVSPVFLVLVSTTEFPSIVLPYFSDKPPFLVPYSPPKSAPVRHARRPLHLSPFRNGAPPRFQISDLEFCRVVVHSDGRVKVQPPTGPSHFTSSANDRCNEVCFYWLAGRCTRRPCKFLHSELPDSHAAAATRFAANLLPGVVLWMRNAS